MMPLVSVVLPVYNGEPFLGHAIASITGQTYRRLEIILIDDGSTDASLETIRRFAAADQRIRVISRGNKGLVGSLNEGLAIAKGKYIARMDADDISLASRIERQVQYMEQNPDVVILGVRTFGKSGNVLHQWIDRGAYGKRICTWALLFGNYIGHPGVCIRREVIEKNNLRYREEFSFVEDYKLWCEATQHGFANVLNRQLLLYRRHDNALSNLHAKEQRMRDRKVSAEQIRSRLGIDAGDLLDCDLQTWIARVRDRIFRSGSFAALPRPDRQAIHLAFQEYSSRLGAPVSGYLKLVGIKPLLMGPAFGSRYIYRSFRYRYTNS